MAEQIPTVGAYGIPLTPVNEDLAWGIRSWNETPRVVMYAAAVVFRDEDGHLVSAHEKAVGDGEALGDREVLTTMLRRVLPLLYDPDYRAEVAALHRRMHEGDPHG